MENTKKRAREENEPDFEFSAPKRMCRGNQTETPPEDRNVEEIAAGLKSLAESVLTARIIDGRWESGKIAQQMNKPDWVVATIEELFDPESPGTFFIS